MILLQFTTYQNEKETEENNKKESYNGCIH